MHEIRIAEDLSRIVLEAASEKNLRKVTGINISFGQLVQIVPEIFEFAFREIVRDSVARDALLDIEIIPVRMKCSKCGIDFRVEDNSFKCSKCGSVDLEIINGKELFIKSLEGE
jgi:hydrogenase nickel incorporation protein HypA/HybF